MVTSVLGTALLGGNEESLISEVSLTPESELGVKDPEQVAFQ